MTNREIDAWKQALYEKQNGQDVLEPVEIDSELHARIQALSHCSFLPASYDKRFVRSIASKQIGEMLTPKQFKTLEGMLYRYRKQLSNQA